MGVSRVLFLIAAVILIAGLVALFFERMGFRWPQLPGDFIFKSERLTIHIPLATSILLSIILSLILNWLLRK